MHHCWSGLMRCSLTNHPRRAKMSWFGFPDVFYFSGTFAQTGCGFFSRQPFIRAKSFFETIFGHFQEASKRAALVPGRAAMAATCIDRGPPMPSCPTCPISVRLHHIFPAKNPNYCSFRPWGERGRSRN